MRFIAQTVTIGTTAVALTACGGNTAQTMVVVRIPPSEMELMGPSTVRHGPPPPVVRTIDGSTHRLTGRVQHVEIDMKNKRIPVSLPFKSRVQDEQLEVFTDQVRTYPVQNISYVEVRYGGIGATPQRNGSAGAGFIVAGLLLGGLSAAVFVENSGYGFGPANHLGGEAASVVGGTLAVMGGGMFIIGVSVAATTPAPPPAKTTRIQPRLRVSPTGGSLSFDF